jgi:hypothetical protein
MGTPTSVKYSRVPGTPADALARFDEHVLPTCGLEYSGFAALRPDDDPYTEGLDLAGDIVPCRSRIEALSLARGWNEWGVSFLSREVPGNVDLYFFGIQKGSFGALVSLESSMPGFKNDEYARGEWLVRLLSAVVATLGCEVCGYGRDNAYETGYDSLEPTTVLARLRAGDFFVMGPPQFHAIAVGLVSPEEMATLLEQYPRGPFLKYGITTTGYHLLRATAP